MGLKDLMKDLRVSNFDELKEYIYSEEHKDEDIVQEIKEFFEYLRKREDKENKQ